MGCYEIWLMPQCLTFHEDVTRQEWQACIDKPELFKGNGYDYGDTIRKLMETAKDDPNSLYTAKNTDGSANNGDYDKNTFATNSFKFGAGLLSVASFATSI